MLAILPEICRRISSLAIPTSSSSITIAARAFSKRSTTWQTRLFSASSVRKALDMETVDTSARLEKLRGLMKENKLDVYSILLDRGLRDYRLV